VRRQEAVPLQLRRAGSIVSGGIAASRAKGRKRQTPELHQLRYGVAGTSQLGTRVRAGSPAPDDESEMGLALPLRRQARVDLASALDEYLPLGWRGVFMKPENRGPA